MISLLIMDDSGKPTTFMRVKALAYKSAYYK